MMTPCKGRYHPENRSALLSTLMKSHKEDSRTPVRFYVKKRTYLYGVAIQSANPVLGISANLQRIYLYIDLINWSI